MVEKKANPKCRGRKPQTPRLYNGLSFADLLEESIKKLDEPIWTQPQPKRRGKGKAKAKAGPKQD